MKYTRLYYDKNAFLTEMRSAVMHAIKSGLVWRRHGVGCLQAYLREGQDEVRVHIWHPDLIRPGITDAGDVHDHRFTLRSCVLHGSIIHEEHEVSEAPYSMRDQAWLHYPVTHIRKGNEYHEAAPGFWMHESFSRQITEGQIYEFEKRRFHRTIPTNLAVTLIKKLDQDDVPALIAAPVGTKPVMAFQDDGLDVKPYIQMAIEAMSL